jgi:putative superfamily III holin-X
MQNATVSRTPFFSLLLRLKDEIKTLIREEIKLAKAELGEKVSMLGKNAAFLAIGGLIAYGGALILFTGIGALLAYFFNKGGMSPLMSICLGLVCIAVAVMVMGGVLVFKALGTFKEESLAPEKTIDAIKHNREINPAEEKAKEMENETEPKRSSDEIKSHIDTTQDMMKEDARELRQRLTPGYMGRAFAAGVRHHPVRAGLIGAASGLVGFFVVKHKRNHHHNGRH